MRLDASIAGKNAFEMSPQEAKSVLDQAKTLRAQLGEGARIVFDKDASGRITGMSESIQPRTSFWSGVKSVLISIGAKFSDRLKETAAARQAQFQARIQDQAGREEQAVVDFGVLLLRAYSGDKDAVPEVDMLKGKNSLATKYYDNAVAQLDGYYEASQKNRKADESPNKPYTANWEATMAARKLVRVAIDPNWIA